MKRYGFKVKKTNWLDTLLDQITDLPEKIIGGVVLALFIMIILSEVFNG